MPNHVHVVVKPLGDWQPEALLHSWKSFTSNLINAKLGETGALWQQDSWNRIIRDGVHWFRVMRYVIRNPVKAGLWSGESMVWVDSTLIGDEGGKVREDGFEEPW